MAERRQYLTTLEWRLFHPGLRKMALMQINADAVCTVRAQFPHVKVDADAETIMFSPQREHSHFVNRMIGKVKS